MEIRTFQVISSEVNYFFLSYVCSVHLQLID